MNKKLALNIIFILLGIILIFHFLILTKQIPYDKVWAGRINSVEEMKFFEIFSILLNLFILSVMVIKHRNLEKENRIIDILIWIIAAFFALNTIGNLFAESMTELILGTFSTLVLSILCVIIVKKKKLTKSSK